MKNRFRLYRRKLGGVFYIHDSQTGKQESLGTRDRAEATTLLNARNESIRQPQLNLHIAKAYLAGTDSGVSTRTWQNALDAIIETKSGSTQDRWRRAVKEAALDLIRDRVIIETQAEQLLACLKTGTVSTNVHLRKLHNFCLSMNWLPWPLIPKRLWPEVRFQPKRAITADEHQLIVGRERNTELRDFYDLCWHLGGSQSDIAHLRADNIDWNDRVIAYARGKTGSLAQIHFGESVEAVLRSRPSEGPLFPRLELMQEKHRAKEFRRRCLGLGIHGVTLHSYRYAWAERAKQCGYPERFAQEALGHNSKAVHRAYARKAKVKLPSLESYERQAADGRIIPLPSHSSENRPGHFGQSVG
jgi:integrase